MNGVLVLHSGYRERFRGLEFGTSQKLLIHGDAVEKLAVQRTACAGLRVGVFVS